MVLSRRLTTESGANGGVVAGAVQIDFLRKLFSQLQLGLGGAVTLFHTDGTLIVRFPSTPGDIGSSHRAVFHDQTVGKGTGLGLSMAKTYAEQSGGRLNVESQPGLGTTVNLWLRR